MAVLHVDFETFCNANVVNVGAQRYARDPSCEVLMMGWAFDNDEPQLWVPDGPWDYDNIPNRVVRHIESGGDVVAHNIEFEWNIFMWVLGIKLETYQCKDTAALALTHGLPKSLAGASTAAGIENRKDQRGKTLIRKFCQPRKPSKHNLETRWWPNMAVEEWDEFCNYCLMDVVVEQELWNYFDGWHFSKTEQWIYEETLRMNERGIPMDIPLAEKTIQFLREYSAACVERCKHLTDGILPTQVGKLLEWLQQEIPSINNLQRIPLERVLIENPELDEKIKEVIQIRLELARVSTKKLEKMMEVDIGDNIVRGSFIYHGAGPGRFTAVGVQPHNFQRPTISNVNRVIELLNINPWQIVKEFDNVLEAVGSAMRGFFKAPDNKILIVADYSAIEARVLAWLAGQEDAVLLFHNGEDIYCDMAGFIFNEDPKQIKQGHSAGRLEEDRQRKLGKDTILGCGYNMSMNTFLLQMENKGSNDIAGIPLRDDPRDRGTSGKYTWNAEAWNMACKAVFGYRKKYNRIKNLWEIMEEGAKRAIRNPGKVYSIRRLIRFKMEDNSLTMKLPSRRKIYYPHCEIVDRENQWTGKTEQAIRFRIVTSRSQWAWEHTYGGKLTENAVQGMARDLLVNGMYQATIHGYTLIGTVHDEIISLCNKTKSLKQFIKLICQLPQWAIGDSLESTIPLAATGYKEMRFKK